MAHPRAIELIDKQIEAAGGGSPSDFDKWHNATEVVLRTVFGEEGSTYKKFKSVRYTPGFYALGEDLSPYRQMGVQEVVAILEAAKLELEIQLGADEPTTDEPSTPPQDSQQSDKIFIVHGRNDARKYELESWLQKLVSDDPIILHQQPNGGKVLIEKFEENAGSVGFAVVLLTGDDFGRPAEFDDHNSRPRARQNVVFELGFFMGLIGRARVAVLYEEGVELPSDINGLTYILLDGAGAWKGKLTSELDHAGIEVDWAALARM